MKGIDFELEEEIDIAIIKFTFLEDKLVIKGASLILTIWLSLTIETIASQHQLSGSNLTNLIVSTP